MDLNEFNETLAVVKTGSGKRGGRLVLGKGSVGSPRKRRGEGVRGVEGNEVGTVRRFRPSHQLFPETENRDQSSSY